MSSSDDLRKKIMEEADRSSFTSHPSISKMYQHLKKMFWWLNVKKDIAEVVSRCLVCQKVRSNTKSLLVCCNSWRLLNGNRKIF